MRTSAPGARSRPITPGVPTEHVIDCPVTVQSRSPPGATERIRRPAGSASANVTLAAVDGPALATASANDTCSPTRTRSASATLTTPTSAYGDGELFTVEVLLAVLTSPPPATIPVL